MRTSKKKSRSILLIIVVLLAIGVLASVVLYQLRTPPDVKADLKRLSEEEYDTVFLSMYPITEYDEADYAYFRGMQLLKTTHPIETEKELDSYMATIGSSGNMISTIYFGVRPELFSGEKMCQLATAYPSVLFEVIPAYGSAEYWQGLSETEFSSAYEAYKEFVSQCIEASLPNMHLYSFGTQEWLFGNPANYVEELETNKELSQTLMLNTDADHPYLFNAENTQKLLDQFEMVLRSYRDAPIEYPDWSNLPIVFFGDSVFGNYTDSASIPGVVNGLTGASVFNCGYGGGSAAIDDEGGFSFPEIVDAFLSGDSSNLPEDKPAFTGIPEFWSLAPKNTPPCFVINYGLNDYFDGHAVANEDALDNSTYLGALRLGIDKLRQAYPTAQILLLTPNFTVYFTNGTEVNSNVGGILTEYVDGVLALSEELGLPVINNYTDLCINAKNHGAYLIDGCHPNETTRFLIGSHIAMKLWDFQSP